MEDSEKTVQAQKILDSNQLMRRLSDKLAEVEEAPQHVSIYRVPSKLQKVKDDAYNPRVVSIGPLHRNNPNLLAMEEHKWRYTLFTFQQTGKFEDTIKCLQKCTDAFYGSDKLPFNKKVRESYAVDLTEIEDRDLAEMMLVDGCFILQLFLKNHQSCDQANDPIFSSAWMLPTLRHDLTLLENQIPFFILEKLYDIIKPRIKNYTAPDSVTTLALKFFQPMYQQEITQDTDTASCKNLLLHLCNNFFPPSSGHIIEVGGPAKPSNQRTIKEGTDTKDSEHLLHLLHNFFRPSSGDPEKPSNQQTIKEGTDTKDCKHLLRLLHNFFRPSSGDPEKPSNQQTKKEVRPRKEKKNKFELCASDLYDGGVQFETGSTDSQLYINFDSHRKVIKIAPLSMDDTTDSLFRNLIAFEQCHLGSSHHIASYVIVMKSLIRSEEDIKLLKKKGIITEEVPEGNYLRDDDFESILNHINLKFFFGQLCDEVNEYSETFNFYFWYKFKARLRRYMKSLHDKYFSSPWSIIAFLAAAVVFCITVTQFLRNIVGS